MFKQDIIQKKSELIKQAYLKAKNAQPDLPVKEYLQFILLKKDYKLPLTDEQEEFLQQATELQNA